MSLFLNRFIVFGTTEDPFEAWGAFKRKIFKVKKCTVEDPSLRSGFATETLGNTKRTFSIRPPGHQNQCKAVT